MKTVIFTLLLLANALLGGGEVAVLNGLAHEFNVTPGNTYQGRIELQNASDNAQVVMLYQTDMSTLFTGETFYTDSLENNRSNKKWIKLSNLDATIESEEKRSIEFEVIVPKSDSLFGTYWSVIMVEPRDPIHIQKDKINRLPIDSRKTKKTRSKVWQQKKYSYIPSQEPQYG